MVRILLVDDDHGLSQTIAEWLKSQGDQVDVSFDGGSAKAAISSIEYDVLILDWQLPVLSGTDLLADLRRQGNTTPVLMLTARSSVESKEEGLDSGADDYLTKPFSMPELSARLRALLRRPKAFFTDVLTAGDVTLHRRTKSVSRGGADVHLSVREFNLLEYLMLHPDKCFTCEELLDHVWESSSDVTPVTVRKYVKQLRQKLGEDERDSLIKNVPGRGYRLDA